MGQALTIVLVIGLIGAVGIGIAKRCEWFKICGDGKINPATGTNEDVAKTEAILKSTGQDSATLAPQITQQVDNANKARLNPGKDAKGKPILPITASDPCVYVPNKGLVQARDNKTPCKSGLGAYAHAHYSRTLGQHGYRLSI